jgi:predicted dehydrogenase
MPVRVAMLSFAHVHANGYADQVKRNPEAEVVCVWDHEEERGRAGAERCGAPFVARLEEALGRADVDAVVVNVETNRHPEVILAAIQAGKHVFTEKALTIRTAESDEIVRAVHASGVKFMISLPQRSSPNVLFARQVVDQGLLGDITMMRMRIAHAAALNAQFRGPSRWFGDKEVAGGGSLFDLGCHAVDVMRWLGGEPESVIAKTGNFTGNYDIDDQCVAIVQFRNKALGILDCTWTHRAGPNTKEIYGTEGFLGWDFPGQNPQLSSRKLELGDYTGTVIPTRLPRPLPSAMEQWVAAILRDEPMHITVEDGRNLTQLLEGIYTSAREGQEVRF